MKTNRRQNRKYHMAFFPFHHPLQMKMNRRQNRSSSPSKEMDNISILPKMKKADSNTDRLSTLPEDVIDAILACLPIRDAVCTSILSRGWRYKWNSLPQLFIDWRSFPFPNKFPMSVHFDKETAKIVDHILLLHRGAINKFKLSAEFVESRRDIDRWILFLSRNGIKEVTLEILEGEIYSLPSYLFSCVDLTYLCLYRCSFIPPTSFKGFCRLTSLALWNVMFAGNGLEILLSTCRLLKNLTLIDITGCSHLEISAPELLNLKIRGVFLDLYFKSIPLLATASITFSASDNSSVANRKCCRIINVFGQGLGIRRIELRNHTLQHLSVGDVPVRLPVTCPVNHLLIHINFEDMQELLATFCIFRSSPVMQKLGIMAISNKNIARESAEGFWAGDEDFECTFSHLQAVEVTNFTGITSELNFIEYILSNGPVLERMHIKFKKNVGCVLEIFRKLVQYPRSSPKAKIIVPA